MPSYNRDKQRKILGKLGEDVAAERLLASGYLILEKNWRWKHFEIDLVAARDNTLHIIEVKSQTGVTFSLPEHRVSAVKLAHLKKAAEQYLYLNPQYKNLQFDIVSLVFTPDDKVADYLLIEDVS